MRTISFHKAEFVCQTCRVNRVKRWNQKCDSCKSKEKFDDSETRMPGVAHQQPAAVLEGENGEKVFVDKLGNKVDNPGYQLDVDPRGYRYTGSKGKDKTFII